MSSFTRNIQRALNRGRFYKGRGSKLGVTNILGKDKLARERREEKKNANSQ